MQTAKQTRNFTTDLSTTFKGKQLMRIEEYYRTTSATKTHENLHFFNTCPLLFYSWTDLLLLMLEDSCIQQLKWVQACCSYTNLHRPTSLAAGERWEKESWKRRVWSKGRRGDEEGKSRNETSFHKQELCSDMTVFNLCWCAYPNLHVLGYH